MKTWYLEGYTGPKHTFQRIRINSFPFRVGRAQYAKALARRGARPVVRNGREFAGFVWVEPGACDARALRSWMVLAEDYVSSLPPKRRSR